VFGVIIVWKTRVYPTIENNVIIMVPYIALRDVEGQVLFDFVGEIKFPLHKKHLFKFPYRVILFFCESI
jgi:hypothetical protein